jgi:hypothetical protein
LIVIFHILTDFLVTYVLSSDTLADDAGVLIDEDLRLLSSLVNTSLGELKEQRVAACL